MAKFGQVELGKHVGQLILALSQMSPTFVVHRDEHRIREGRGSLHSNSKDRKRMSHALASPFDGVGSAEIERKFSPNALDFRSLLQLPQQQPPFTLIRRVAAL
jgi:hypothetical protein